MYRTDRTATPTMTRRLTTAGFSLVEVLVSLAIFTLVIIAAYNVYIRSIQTSERGKSVSEMTQSGRVALDQLVHEIRLAGFEYDVDGPTATYPQMPDEPIEFMHERAISIRANFDGNDEFGGREPALEYVDLDPSSQENMCCPIVTTGNDEIITYALGKSPGAPDQPDDTITMKYDTTGTQDEPDGDGFYDNDIRDATVGDDDIIRDEETIEIGEVHLGDPDDPPYTLYRFYWDDGALQRQPLVDNVSSLRFVYYNEQGEEVTPVGGDDDGTGSGDDRSARASVRRIDVFVEVLESEPDLRWNDPDAPNDYAKKRRNYEFSSTVIPPNLGTRGQIDRSITAPLPPTNVQVTTGCCEWIRVEWEPPPVEERVADYVVTLFESPPDPNDLSNVIASFIVQSKLDLTQTPAREYATWNRNDDWDIQQGREIWAQVVARSDGGSESEPAPEFPPEAQASATVRQSSRPGLLEGAQATGYDPEQPSWPDADPENIGGAPIQTDDTAASYPRAGVIQVTIEPPAFVLNEGASTGSDAAGTNWTTKSSEVGGIVAALDGTEEHANSGKGYHVQEASPGDTVAERRTAFNNPQIRPGFDNTYIFRVSGSDPWNWDGEDDADARVGSTGVIVSDPRNFIPGPANLHDFTSLNLANNSVIYEDRSGYDFASWGDPSDLRDDRFSETRAALASVAGSSVEPAIAVAPGEVYYYRFRVVDLCWEDRNPKDGVFDDDTAVKAWSIQEDNDFPDEITWREKSLPLSPFFPPLNPNGPAGEDRLIPNSGVDDSDNVTRISGINAYAIPGYALPIQDEDGDTVPPSAPNELYLARLSGNDILSNDGARPYFNASRRSAFVDGGDPADTAITHYELHRKAASAHPDSITSSELDFDPSSTTKFLEFRTNGPRSLLRYTIDADDEGAPTPAATAEDCDTFLDSQGEPSGTDVDDLVRLNCLGVATVNRNDGLPDNDYPYIYRLVAVQAPDWAIDDGIDTSAGFRGDPSPPFVFPCDLYDQLRAVDLDPEPNPANPTSIAVSVSMADTIDSPPEDPDDETCDELAAARLMAFRQGTGDFIGTSDWMEIPVDGNQCTFTFSQTEIDQALRGHTGGNVRYVTELTTVTSAVGESGFAPVGGCKVRSDLPGKACEACGTQDTAEACLGCSESQLLGPLSVSLGADGRTLDLTLDVACESRFTLAMVETRLRQDAASEGPPIPDVMSANVIEVDADGNEGTPSPLDIPGAPHHRDDLSMGAETEVRLRWFDNLTTRPVITADADKLIVRLQFQADLCDVFVDEFNFRFEANDDPDILCTVRGTDDPASDGTNLNPEGSGRLGPLTSFGECEPACDPFCVNDMNQGTCPLQDCDDIPGAMDDNPATSLASDDNGNADQRIVADWRQTCEDCDVSPTALRVVLNKPSNCLEDFFGSPIGCMGDLVPDGASILLDGGDPIPLGAPDTLDDEACCTATYEWLNIDNVTVGPAQVMRLQLDFDGPMGGLRMQELTVTFPGDNDPLPPGPSGDIECHLVDDLSQAIPFGSLCP